MTQTTTNQSNQTQYGWRSAGIAAAITAVLVLLLALDLQFRGLAWQFFRSQTGEETPLAQIRGMVEVSGNLLRVPPQTRPVTPIQHTDDVPFGINTFLQLEADPAKRDEQLRMINAAGFEWIRQEFPWEDIEVDGRGQFTDSRNDYDGDGVPDTISGWRKYDNIVELSEKYDIGMTVRLSNPPDWSRSDPDAGDLGPPDNIADFVNFAVAVAERYEGRITHFQIWNEPNIFPEWGNDFVDPAGYTEMLCRTYEALKRVDPEIVVISAAIAPTKSLDGYVGYQDLVFLQNMYDNGAADCFDVLSAQGYGLFSGPTDRRYRATDVNFQRHVMYRDIMVANGDAHKPIWLSEVAWNAVLSAELSRDQINDFDRFGTVTDEQNARYVPRAYQRVREEWPWIGHVSYWFFTRPDDREVNQSFFYFRMAEPDYSPEKPTFTPLPVYQSMTDYIEATRENPVLYRGVHQAQSWEVQRPDTAQLVPAESAQFENALQTTSMQFTANGTRVLLRLKADTPDATVQINVSGSDDMREIALSEDWQTVTLYESFLPAEHTVTVTGEALVDSLTILDATWRHVLPGALTVGALGLLGLLYLLRLSLRRLTA